MNNIYLIIISILIILNLLSLSLGVVLGRLWSMSGVINSDKPKSFLKSSRQTPQAVAIDDKVYVTNIKTDGMIKKYDGLGEVKKSNENITSSIDKLKQMKG